MSDSIYHSKSGDKLGPVIKLNLRAVCELLDRDVPHFDALSPQDKDLLQKRFSVYCKNGSPDFGLGCEASKTHPEHPPSIDHLPNKNAVHIAIEKVKAKGGGK